jgi:hypothetical protein
MHAANWMKTKKQKAKQAADVIPIQRKNLPAASASFFHLYVFVCNPLIVKLKNEKMRKKILLATSALAITAGSVFSYANSGESVTARTSTEQCPPECCNGSGGDCGAIPCGKSTEACCQL